MMRITVKLLAGAGIAAIGAYWFAAGAQDREAHATKPLGGDIIPARQVFDSYPVFNGIAVDAANNLVAMTDVNRKSLLVYDRIADSAKTGEQTASKHNVLGPETNLGFVAGVLLDPEKREMYAVNNDIEDTMVVMRYGSEGNLKPARILSVPHQAWGVALGRAKNQIAISVELHQAIVFYRREANGVEPPVRYIRGADTRLADPHGIYWDETHNEIAVANHGNFRGLVRDIGAGCIPTGTADAEGGEFQPPSIAIYSAEAEGNQKPLRVIQGPHTQLDFPMGIAIDPAHGEIAVANNGDSSILIFARSASGDVAPVRVIKGSQTGVNRPMGVAIDGKNDELWVANFGDHSAVAFQRADAGNVAPRRVIRSAPAGTPVSGFGNPQTVAYDSTREQILVPN
jgi:DNA-binding beta-propeller fold protein YncE